MNADRMGSDEPRSRRDEGTRDAPVGRWVSDLVVDLLAEIDVRYIALNPGASYRGLHDSLVNYGNGSPEILTCLHEEHAVAIAHGYAKVTGRPMAVALHSNVGLMHASMALYNAWCDRVPMLVIGATGPMDAAARRPWIEWVHTASDQAALVRAFVKWDDQPSSADAACEAILRANSLTRTTPCAPVYVCLDAALQESPLEPTLDTWEAARYGPAEATAPGPGLDEAVRVLRAAQRPVIMIGRAGRSEEDWAVRVRLAETLSARVISDLKCGATFPTRHPLSLTPGQTLSAEAAAALRGADAILSLDWVDLGATLRQACGGEPSGTVISCSADDALWNGWSKDHGGFAPADVRLHVGADVAAVALLDALDGSTASPAAADIRSAAPADDTPQHRDAGAHSSGLLLSEIGQVLARVAATRPVSLVRLPLSWQGDWLDFAHPLEFIGYDLGGAVGSGPGMAIGSALALRGTGRMPIAVLGDGDTSMGMSALWTAARYRIPVLIIVANNQTYGNDEVHQEHVARVRNRPEANSWVGQRMSDPELDFATLARAQGWDAFGPVGTRAELDRVFTPAVDAVAAGRCALIDVRVTRARAADDAPFGATAESPGDRA